MNIVKPYQGPVSLKGITWSHARGYAPMEATAGSFRELNPGVEIVWEKRSLQRFADESIERLAEKYDLLVIDHPWAGQIAASGALVALETLLPREFLDDQARQAVGRSYESYHYNHRQWALPIDTAAPVSVCRPDLMERHACLLPQRWEDLIKLARAGHVCCPGIPLDVYGNFLNLCASAGRATFVDGCVAEVEDGTWALEKLREFTSLIPERFLELDPIRTLEVMASEDDYAYCPYTYGYSNYSRPGFRGHPLRFGEIISVEGGRPGITMLGGAGLAISSHCAHPAVAARYARFVSDAEIQKGIYFSSGGQPGHRSAWLSEEVNRGSANFFRDTHAVLDRAFVRPRFPGYLGFQDHAGGLIHAYLRRGGNAAAVVEKLNVLFRKASECYETA